LLFTFWSEKFITEPLKDDDPEVVAMKTDEIVTRIWNLYKDGNADNKYSD